MSSVRPPLRWDRRLRLLRGSRQAYRYRLEVYRTLGVNNAHSHGRNRYCEVPLAMAKYKLLSVESDSKTIKGSKKGYLTGVMYLAPSTEASDVDVCPMATDECRHACLYGAGMAC